jgi:protein-tyrosine phosphatase
LATSFNILVICTANICRSPAVAMLLQDALANKNVKVSSAGTLALNGNKAVDVMRKLLVERGLHQIEDHRSQALMPHHLSQADLIFCMDHEHVARVLQMNPVLKGKVKLMGHFENKSEVSDPYGHDELVYIQSIEQMQRLTTQWVDKMQQMGLV